MIGYKIQECKSDQEIIKVYNSILCDYYSNKINKKYFQIVVSDVQNRIAQLLKEK